MNDLLRLATSPHSLLIGLKQTGLLTDIFYKLFGPLSCPYWCSFKPISFLLVVVSLLLIDISPWTLLRPQQTIAQFNQFCWLSTRLMPKVCRQSHSDSRRNSNRIFFSLHVVALRKCSLNFRRSYFVSHRCHHVINESLRGGSLCHNDVIMTWTNVDECAARAMCFGNNFYSYEL